MIDENKKWMSSGKVGCTFAALFAKNPEKIGWVTITINNLTEKLIIPKSTFILSIQFPISWDASKVRKWALDNGFEEEMVNGGYIGLRYKVNSLVAWVQYFGKDSHVLTRQSPIPELCMCLKLPAKYYFKVGFDGILHLAHASVSGIKDKIADKLWETSHKNTEKRLGHKAGKKEAGKVTWERY